MTDTRDYGDSDTYYSDDNVSSLEEDNKKTRIEVCTKEKPIKIIHRNYLPRDKITRCHVISILGPEFVNNDEVLTATTKHVTTLKKDALDFFREEVRKMMTKKLHEVGVYRKDGTKLRHLKELRSFISKQRLPLKFFPKYFSVMYGVFDLTLDWTLKIEAMYMRQNKLEYSKETIQKHKGRQRLYISENSVKQYKKYEEA